MGPLGDTELVKAVETASSGQKETSAVVLILAIQAEIRTSFAVVVFPSVTTTGVDKTGLTSLW